MLLNAPLSANATTPVASGDILTIADIRITVVTEQAPAILVPRFVPLEPDAPSTIANGPVGPPAGASSRPLEERRRQPESDEASRAEEWKRRDAELIRRARDLDRQTEELESDRVLWYQRRQEIEQELERQRAAVGLAGVHKADLDARDRELARVRDELSAPAVAQEFQDWPTNWPDSRRRFARPRDWWPTEKARRRAEPARAVLQADLEGIDGSNEVAGRRVVYRNCDSGERPRR